LRNFKKETRPPDSKKIMARAVWNWREKSIEEEISVEIEESLPTKVKIIIPKAERR